MKAYHIGHLAGIDGTGAGVKRGSVTRAKEILMPGCAIRLITRI